MKTHCESEHTLTLLIERIRSRCHVEGDCLLWDAGTSASGYGRMHLTESERSLLMLDSSEWVHRVMWAALHGPIEPGTIVKRSCGRRECCAPDHLHTGSDGSTVRALCWHPAVRADIIRRRERGESPASIAQVLGLPASEVLRVEHGRFRKNLRYTG